MKNCNFQKKVQLRMSCKRGHRAGVVVHLSILNFFSPVAETTFAFGMGSQTGCQNGEWGAIWQQNEIMIQKN